MNYSDPAIEDDKPEVNLTSMLDVVFIMLVFFIITASFIREDAIPVNLPPSTDEVPSELASIVVRVEPGSVFRVENRVLSRGGLLPYLAATLSQNPDAGFAVEVARGSVVRDMMVAADAGRMLGFDVIAVRKEE